MKPWRYGLGMLALTVPSEAFGTFLSYFYLDRLGLPVAAFAFWRTLYKTGGVGAIMPRTSVRGYMDPHFCL